jgi:hypothetical protein
MARVYVIGLLNYEKSSKRRVIAVSRAIENLLCSTVNFNFLGEPKSTFGSPF